MKARSLSPGSAQAGLGRIASAAPDGVTALVYAITWCAPFSFGIGTVKALMLVMLMEFVLVHASGFFFAVALGGRGSRIYFAAISASVVSSMRFEKPHSLSYHEHTLTSVPPMTLVRVLS
jgi:hypothetical protein